MHSERNGQISAKGKRPVTDGILTFDQRSRRWLRNNLVGDTDDARQRLTLSWKYPANFTELTISIVYFVFSLPILVVISRILGQIFQLLFLLLPYYPAKEGQDLRDGEISTKNLHACFWSFCLLGLVFSLVVFSYVVHMDGRFHAVADYDPRTGYNIYNFLDDWANQWLYVIVVPFYVGVGALITFLCLSFQRKKTVRKTKDYSGTNLRQCSVMHGTRPEISGTPSQTAFMVLAVLVFCAVLTTQYQRDVWDLLLKDYTEHFKQQNAEGQGTDRTLRALPLYEEFFGSIPNRTKKFETAPILYWFLEIESPEDCWIRHVWFVPDFEPEGVCYNASGYYYLVLNFGLLLFTVVSVLFFLSAAFSVIGLRQKIKDGEYENFGDISSDLRPYILSFIFAKWLFLAYIINTYIWRGSFLGKTDVVDTTIAAYTIIGSIILPIPNRIVETTWYARQRRRYLEEGAPRPSFESLVPTGWPMVLKNVANLLIATIFVDTIFDVPLQVDEFIDFVVRQDEETKP